MRRDALVDPAPSLIPPMEGRVGEGGKLYRWRNEGRGSEDEMKDG